MKPHPSYPGFLVKYRITGDKERPGLVGHEATAVVRGATDAEGDIRRGRTLQLTVRGATIMAVGA